jgi:hypothetical protein
MEKIAEPDFDKLVDYTLRVELADGKVLIYRIDTDSKNYLINKLRENSDGDKDSRDIDFLWFETSVNRIVIINVDSIVRTTFCFDHKETSQKSNAYFDNFKLLDKETYLEELQTKEGEVQLHVVEDHFLPQAIIFHKGKAPDDGYDRNPLTYSELNPSCLEGFEMELEGDWPFRQFLALIDNDGEESFIPMKQIIIMELDKDLIFPEDDMEDDTGNELTNF